MLFHTAKGSIIHEKWRVMSMHAKFERERYCVQHLAMHLGLPDDLECRDPMAVSGYETGADVWMRIGSRLIGVQVTEYDGGEGVPGLRPGQIRASEKKLKRQAGNGGVYAGWGSPHIETALPARIAAKVQSCKAYTFAGYDEVWLLVSANVPDVGLSTFVPRSHISSDQLNMWTNVTLADSKYARAFFHIIMGDVVFYWDQVNGWKNIVRRRSSHLDGHKNP
jgi:hypothetical protein